MDLEEHIILTKLVDQVVLVVVLAVHLLVDILVDLLVEQELETLEELIIAILHQMDGVMMVDLLHLVQDSLVQAAVVVPALMVVGEVLVELLDLVVLVYLIV